MRALLWGNIGEYTLMRSAHAFQQRPKGAPLSFVEARHGRAESSRIRRYCPKATLGIYQWCVKNRITADLDLSDCAALFG